MANLKSSSLTLYLLLVQASTCYVLRNERTKRNIGNNKEMNKTSDSYDSGGSDSLRTIHNAEGRNRNLRTITVSSTSQSSPITPTQFHMSTTNKYENLRRYSRQATLVVCIGFIPGLAFFFICCRYVPDWCADKFDL